MDKNTVEVPKEIIIGLYRIMCDIPSTISGYEVYPEAIPGMQEAYNWIIDYGKSCNIDMRGHNEHLISKIKESDCTCTVDQYGYALNPQCILHGEKR